MMKRITLIRSICCFPLKFPGKRLQTSVFFLMVLWLGSVPAQNITQIEYFFDTDPGYGLGTSLPLTPGPNLDNLVYDIPVSALSSGFHNLYIRARDDNGAWSLTNVQTFYKESGNPVLPDVTKVEYFFDTDPGHGLGTNLPITPGTNLSNLAFNIYVTALQEGFHNLYIRSMDAYGKWSLTHNQAFYKEPATALLPDVTKLEYFFDTDPGHGLGTNLPITPGTNLSNLVFNIEVTALQEGFHNIYVRSKDSYGRWSLTHNQTFYKSPGSSLPNITKIEYFFDADPGFGSGMAFPVTPSTNITSLLVPIDVTCLSNGKHTVYIRSLDDYGRWSLTSNDTIRVTRVQPQIAVAGPTIFCEGDSVKFTAPAGDNLSYQWHRDNVPIPGAINGVYCPRLAGSYYAKIRHNDLCNDTTNVVSTTAKPAPMPVIAGPNSVCVVQPTAVYMTEAGMTGYQWAVSAGGSIVSGTGTNTVTITWNTAGARKVTVNYTGINGCAAVVPTEYPVTVIPLPALPGSITGPVQVIQGQTGVGFSVGSIANATGYAWTLPPGASIVSADNTASIVVDFSAGAVSGDISVHGTNSCGNGSESGSLTVKVVPTSVVLSNVAVESGQVTCYSAAQTIYVAGSGTAFEVKTGGSATMIAGQNILYRPNTKVFNGGYMHGSITTSSQYCVTQPAPMVAIATGVDSREDPVVPTSSFKVYPNPTTGSFTLDLTDQVSSGNVRVVIYNMQGARLMTYEMSGERTHVFSLSGQPAGLYLIDVAAGTRREMVRVVRE